MYDGYYGLTDANDYEAARLEALYEQYQRDLQRELEEAETSPEDDAIALDRCHRLALEADNQADYEQRCISGEKVFYYEYPKALIPGHINTPLGVDEFGISRACEYHFDEWFKDEDED